jgi:hypothetical protein
LIGFVDRSAFLAIFCLRAGELLMPTGHAKSAVVAPREVNPAAPKAAVPLAADASPEVRFEALLQRVGAKVRVNIEKHLALCDAEPNPGHGRLWRRLASKLGELAPMPVQIAGPQAVQFFVADGKYREQVFSLEDLRDGNLSIYLTDILADAVAAKVIKKVPGGYTSAGVKKEPLAIESLDSTTTRDPAPHMKHMIGWNRKAIRIIINTSDSSENVVAAAEGLCEQAAKRWQDKAASA